MSLAAAAFLGGAKSRLLPASVPFSFFTAATGFQVLAWGALVLSADELPGFRGGPGLILAAIHLLTLGVLVTTAMGAAFQLLPVATRRPLAAVWLAWLSFWLQVLGTFVLTFGMAIGGQEAMYAGASIVTGALVIFMLIVADNLRRAPDLPVVAAHGWGSLVAMLGFISLGIALIADYGTGLLTEHQSVALAHMILAAFGFMGLLSFGFSQVLIPMFALSRALPPRLGWSEFWLSIAACALGSIAALSGYRAGLLIAVMVGLGALGAYLWLMKEALRTGMRKRLGLSFVLIKLSWACLALCLALGLVLLSGITAPNGGVLFGFLLLSGWLLTFLTGILQRIMPFLASMHVAGKNSKPALLSELTAGLPLKIHAVCHIGAVVLCSIGIGANSVFLARSGATLGLVGALAFALFASLIVVRLRTVEK